MAEVAFTTGGTVQAGSGLYVRRKADDELLNHCLRGEYASVLSARQVGKSSLMVNVARELAQRGVQSAVVDLSSIGQGVVDAAQWYNGILRAVADELGMSGELEAWTDADSARSPSERFVQFFRTFLLPKLPGQVVIFLDEIDTTLNLPFTDDFFAAIRFLYNARSQDSNLKRLSFVLIGVAIAADLVKDPKRTPFNIAERVNLDDFGEDEVLKLVAALRLSGQETQNVANWVYGWTGGHPYLTQRMLRAMAEDSRTTWSRADVDALVESVFLADESSRGDSNLNNLEWRLSSGTRYTYPMLKTYARIIGGFTPVFDEQRSLAKAYLKLFGVVKRSGRRLVVRNAIYRRVFDLQWVREQKTMRQERLARRANIIAGILFLLLSAVGAYSWLQRREAQREHQLRIQVDVQRKEADKQRQEAEKGRRDAVTQTQLADAARLEAEHQRALAEDRQRQLAAAAEKEAELAQEAEVARGEAVTQSAIALDQKKQADDNAALATRRAASEKEARDLAEKKTTEEAAAAKRADDLAGQRLGYKLAGDADFMRVQTPERVDQAMLLDIESYRRLQSSDALQGFQALGSGLEKLPKTFARWNSPAKISALALSGDGSQMIVGNADGKVRRINLTGEPVDLVDRDLKDVAAVALGSDVLAVDRKGRALGQPSPPEDQRLLAVRSDAHGYAAVVVSDPRKVNYWPAGSTSPKVLHHRAKVLLAAFSDWHLFTFCEDSTIYQWSLSSLGATHYQIPKDQPPAEAKYLVVREGSLTTPTIILGSGNTIRVYNVRVAYGRRLLILDRFTYTAQLARTLQHEASVTAMAAVPTSNFLTTATATTLRRWDISAGREVFRISPGHSIEAIALSGDDRYVAAAYILAPQTGDSVAVWPVDGGPVVASLPLLTPSPMPLAFSSDGQKLAVTNGRESSSWDWRRGARETTGTFRAITSFEHSLDGRVTAEIVTETEQRPAPIPLGLTKTVPVFATYLIFVDRSSGIQKTKIPLSMAASNLDISPDGEYAAVSTSSGLKLYRADSGAAVPGFDYPHPATPIAVAPNGEFVAAGQPDRVDIIQGAQVIATVKIANPRSLYFSRDGKYLAVGAADGPRLVPVGHWQNPQKISTAAATTVALSPDSRYIAVRENDTSVRIVAIGNQRSDPGLVLNLPFAVSRMAFSPDHKYLATGSPDRIRVLPWQAEDLIDEACQRVRTKALTPVEWKNYLSGEPQTAPTCPAQK